MVRKVFLVAEVAFFAALMLCGCTVLAILIPKDADAAAWVQAVGSILAILVAVWVSRDQNASIAREARQREAEEVQHLLRSLRDEIKLATEDFEASSGRHIAESERGTPHFWTIPVPERPFVIYDANIPAIGKVQDDALRQLIIASYGVAQGFIHTLRFNNSLVSKWEHARYLAAVTKDDVHQQMLRGAKEQLRVYGDVVRSDYARVTALTDQLIPALERHITQRPSAA